MSDEDEQFLRQLAKQKFGNTKGAISKTITQTIKEMAADQRRKNFLKFIKRATKENLGSLNGGKAYESRNELYDR